MKKIIRLKWLFVLWLSMISCIGNDKKTVNLKPNIILIMTDDLGWYDVGFNGNDSIRTPNLDMLANKGVIFNRFYSASAVCSPTRASVITGRNPIRMSITRANTGHMLEEEITLPEILSGHGYKNGHFGKWHLGTLSKEMVDGNRGGRKEFIEQYSHPKMHGYDEYFCTESKVPTFDPMICPIVFEEGESLEYGWKEIKNKNASKKVATNYWVGVEEKADTNLSGDDSKIIMDQALAFINKSVENNDPFFTTIWTHTPHLPVVSDSLHRSYYNTLDFKTSLYYGTITAMDEQVGRLWSELGELGIQDQTVIFFCSDNGPEDNTPGSAGVFREGKRSLYEGGVRVPSFMLWQNQLEGGRAVDFQAVTSDYLPTILEIVNVPYPSNRVIDGISFLEKLKTSTKISRPGIGFLFFKKMSWVTDQYKLISIDKGETFELYDLVHDKSEKKNIINEHPEIAAQMKIDLEVWMRSVENSKAGLDYSWYSKLWNKILSVF